MNALFFTTLTHHEWRQIMLAIGDTAPDFQLIDQYGESASLEQILANGEAIVYFYPVCTAEACSFRDNFDSVAEIGTQIIGISPQSVSSHRRFSNQFKLPFPLLSDSKKSVIRAYGVDGLFGMGVRRVTFLIDQKQVVVNRVVSDLFVGSHTDLLKETIQRHKVGKM
jgi:peroxiredoxin Q/BCP